MPVAVGVAPQRRLVSKFVEADPATRGVSVTLLEIVDLRALELRAMRSPAITRIVDDRMPVARLDAVAAVVVVGVDLRLSAVLCDREAAEDLVVVAEILRQDPQHRQV